MCDRITDDERHFGYEKWVYCKAHVRPHTTGWCTVPHSQKVLLTANNYDDARNEAKSLGFEIYGEE